MEEVLAGVPVEGAEFALKRVCCLLLLTQALDHLVTSCMTPLCMTALSLRGLEVITRSSAQVLAATGEAAELAEREIQVMQQLQHPNIMPLLAHSRAIAPMDADQGVTTYYMLFPLFKVRHTLFLFLYLA